MSEQRFFKPAILIAMSPGLFRRSIFFDNSFEKFSPAPCIYPLFELVSSFDFSRLISP